MRRIIPTIVFFLVFFPSISQNLKHLQLPEVVMHNEAIGDANPTAREEAQSFISLMNLQMNDEFQLDSLFQYKWDVTTQDWIPYWFAYAPWKGVFFYDENGNDTLSIYYIWDTIANDWKGSNKWESTYDEHGNRLSYTSYDWDTIANDWKGSNKWESTYDTQWNQTLRISYVWDTFANDWIIYNKHKNTYDAQGNQTLSIAYIWDDTSNDWKGSDKQEHTYDAQGNQTLSSYYEWDDTSNDWVGDWKNVYTYDTQGNQTLRIWYVWDTIANDWIEESKRKVECTYDAQGNQTNEIWYDWDDAANDWEGSHRYENIYDTQGNQILMIRYDWDDTSNDWKGSRKLEFTYDAHGNLTFDIEYDWDDTANDWIRKYKFETFYSRKGTSNNVFNLSETLLTIEEEANSTATFNISSNINWTILGLNSWLRADISSGTGDATITLTAEENASFEPRTETILISSYELSDRYVYVTQEASAVGINNLSSGDINLYPNPTNESLYVEGLQKETIGKIYNANGQMLLIGEIGAENGSIIVSQLPSGLYILKMDVDDYVVMKRFMKEK